MSIIIDKEKCRKCGKCTQVCPGSLIKKDEDGQECQFDAIGLYLGADIGGMGSSMTVKSRDHFLDWNIHKTDGSTETIIIDKKESNKY